MSDDRPTTWCDAVVCAVCDRRLIPLSYARASTGDETMGIANRPALKCSGCGQRYQWQDSSGWAPVDPSSGEAGTAVHLVGQARRVRRRAPSGSQRKDWAVPTA